MADQTDEMLLHVLTVAGSWAGRPDQKLLRHLIDMAIVEVDERMTATGYIRQWPAPDCMAPADGPPDATTLRPPFLSLVKSGAS